MTWRHSIISLALSPLCAQASYTTFGLGCGDSWGEPRTRAQMVLSGVPRIGQSVQVSVVGPHFTSRGYSRANMLVTGTSRTSYAGLTLPHLIPWWLIGGGGTDCYALCSIEATEILSPAFRQIDIPANASLIGLRLYQQWYLSYVLRGPTVEVFYITSDAADMTIGL